MEKHSYYKEGAWWTSPFNEKEEVKKTFPNHTVEIHDATLRDGEQTPGVVFTADQKFDIASKLYEAGIRRIEAGMPAVSADDASAAKRIANEFKDAEVYAFVRAMATDIDLAAETGAKGVIIEVPIGYPKLKYQFNWTWEKVFEKSASCINYAKQCGLKAVYFPYDATRANEDDIENLFSNLMKDARPDAIGLVDTMGCALPETIAYMVRWYKSITNGLPIEVHCHNDFGMAVACELAGASAGAEVLHACVNGLGERTGNAALEEIVLALKLLMGMDCRYDIEKLDPLCRMVEQYSGIKCAHNKPFGGDRNYTRESGIGVNLVMEQPLAMFATDPRYFNKTANVVLGKKSGKLSVSYKLNQMGMTATDEQIAQILAGVKELGIKKKGLLSDQEFLSIVKECM